MDGAKGWTAMGATSTLCGADETHGLQEARRKVALAQVRAEDGAKVWVDQIFELDSPPVPVAAGNSVQHTHATHRSETTQIRTCIVFLDHVQNVHIHATRARFL